jgi:hypothetical protein
MTSCIDEGMGKRKEGAEIEEETYFILTTATTNFIQWSEKLNTSKRYWLNDTRPTREKEEFGERNVQVSIRLPQIA